METLAYLHHQLAYDDPEQYEVTFDWDSLHPGQHSSLSQFPGQTLFRLTALVAGLGVLLTSNQAWAVLRHGDMDVSTLQNDLIRSGYLSPGLATGRFLDLTESAVRQLQRDCGIAVDGVVGPQTQSCLHGQLPSPPTGGGVLRFGSQGPAVTSLQQDLVQLGYLSPNLVTGFFGAQTEQAVKQAQAACGIHIDGVVGPATRACISNSLAGSPQRPVTGPIVVQPSVIRPVVTNPVIINRPVVVTQPVVAVSQPSETRTVVLSDGTVIEVAVR